MKIKAGIEHETDHEVEHQVEADSLSGSQTGRLSFKLASTMDSVAEVEAAAERLTQAAGLDEDEGFRVSMAVQEAAVNAVLHGNGYDPAKQISASFENNGKSLIITIADEGEGLDPDKIPDPLAPENLLRGTGRGIFLIRSFLDEVHFRQLHPGTELTLVKHLAPAASQETPEDAAPNGLDNGPQDSETK